MADQKHFVSMNPDTFSEGGGLIDDVNVVIKDAIFCMTDYQGKMQVEQPVAKVTFDIDGEETKQYYSVGDRAKFAPSEDGRHIVQVGTAEKFTKKSKFAMLLTSLVNCGMEKSKLEDGDIKAMVGIGGHVMRVSYANTMKDSKKDDTVLVFDKVDTWPGDGKGKGGKKGGTPKAEPETGAGNSDEIRSEAEGLVMELIAGADGGSIKQKDLLIAATKSDKLKGSQNKKGLVSLITDDKFIVRKDAPWTVENGILTL
uniref:Uncharacterized protein n=1 Tax=viral metagenome TaxID=1070528 RepID=A0A6M3IJH9_9ZZZZ